MSTRGGKLIATDEPTVVTESLFDSIVMKDGQSDGRLADSTGTDESDGREVFGQANDLLDQLVTPETGPRCRRRRFTNGARCKDKMLDPLATEFANLV